MKAVPSTGVEGRRRAPAAEALTGRDRCSCSLSVGLEEKWWAVGLAQAGLEAGRLQLEGQGARKLTAGEGPRDEPRFWRRGKPCRLQGLKGWKETHGVRG